MEINGYPRLSDMVAGKKSLYSKKAKLVGDTIEQLSEMLGCDIKLVLSQETYESMGKDPNTLYIIEEDEYCIMCYGELPVINEE